MRISLIFICLLIASVSKAQFKITTPVKWSYKAVKSANNEAVLFLKGTIEDGWHIYAQDGGIKSLQTSFAFSNAKNYALIGRTTAPKSLTKYEKVLKANVSYYEKSVIFQQKIKINAAQVKVKGKLEFTVCNATECRPAEEVEFSIPIT
ncbi:protein-disulfide reductase DsbD domain-containing protein [Pedobacter sp. Leaf194]|uniref:protein-disulfide reductase DsbD domain-containing protein n=1 Tax=Pedobacter sp. Leaf194 TaxID=1736297 RepID=UPI000702B1BC|nr:protein-disulfide reductase DsbD domain-containing protein [Pedobacter sp. Leaf194]KQS35286.1 sugar transporter [Pedobacter sp. Leaf194]